LPVPLFLPTSVARPSASTILVVVVVLYSAALTAVSHPLIPLDDAAIAFRYAERIAEGHGFTYNDHERVSGASNPLYVLLLAIGITAGVPAPTVALGIGCLAYVAAAGMVSALAMRVRGLAAGAAAAIVLAGETFFRYQALNGMEVGLASALGLGAVLAAGAGRQRSAGVLAGLALWNKLDAAAVVLSILAAEAIHRRRVALPYVSACMLTCGPWIAWASWYFATPIPNSLTTKLAGGERLPFDPLWVARFLAEPARRYAVLLAAIGLARCVVPRGSCFATTALSSWVVIHCFAYSVVDLGAPYPWYLAVPLAPVAALAGIALGSAVDAPTRADWRRPATVGIGIIGAAALLHAALESASSWRRRDVLAWEAFESDRRLAGIVLRGRATAGEILDSPYGWAAFESRLPINDTSGLNSVMTLGPPSYRIEERPAGDLPTGSDGLVRLATFGLANATAPHYPRVLLFGRVESAADATRWVLSDEDLRQLGNPTLVAAWRDHLQRHSPADSPATATTRRSTRQSPGRETPTR
jgi:hypothetical protein